MNLFCHQDQMNGNSDNPKDKKYPLDCPEDKLIRAYSIKFYTSGARIFDSTLCNIIFGILI